LIRIAHRERLSTSEMARQAIVAWVDRHEIITSPYEAGRIRSHRYCAQRESSWLVENGTALRETPERSPALARHEQLAV
jgi:hypothetical protein